MTSSIQYLLLATGAAFALVAMTLMLSRSTSEPMASSYSGYVYMGFENQTFHPCDSAEIWWIEEGYPEDLNIAYRRLTGTKGMRTTDAHPIFAEVRGLVSALGNYGHLGVSDRAIDVQEVLRTDRVYTHGRQCKPKRPDS